MLLAIEQGNTNTLFAVHDGQEWIFQWRTATDPMRTADEYAVWLHQLFEMRGRTLSHAFIIVDEAQNTSRMQMKMRDRKSVV